MIIKSISINNIDILAQKSIDLYTILSLSDSDKHFDSAISEYTKRMSKNLILIKLKPSKADQVEFAKKVDTDTILDRLSKHSKNYDMVVLLSITAKDSPTEDRVRMFPLGKKVCFIIGGPHGLNEEKLVIQNAEFKMIGLGRQTMVHGLAKLVLLEQLYRIRMIGQNRSYHY